MACIMPVEQFVKVCESGGYIDYDGYGVYADDEWVYPDVIVVPSDVVRPGFKPLAPFVSWYNR